MSRPPVSARFTGSPASRSGATVASSASASSPMSAFFRRPEAGAGPAAGSGVSVTVRRPPRTVIVADGGSALTPA
nr:hypothetical protein GCM10020093_046380 [Planobispora longispora]